MLALHINGLSQRFHERFLFEDLSFTLPGGKTTCLLGRSGVGKSTLLRLLVGLESPESGTILDEKGEDLTGRVAYMAQEDSLLPWLSVKDNVLLGYRLRGALTEATKEDAKEFLRRAGLGEVSGSLPAALSGGMRQRAALVRTLAEGADFIFMDEPFSALDPVTRLALQDLCAEILKGKTILLVTHDPLEALRLGHEIRLLAGFPARLGKPFCPEGLPPRSLQDQALLKLQGELLTALGAQGDDAAEKFLP